MLIPFLKIPAHYSTSDRAGLKRVEKNLKIKKEKSVKNQKKEKDQPPQKTLFLRGYRLN
ncbi:hypothetical protein N202_08445 [Helicobacter pylori UM067]|nr:hypothetical protein N202_08445 [Helicobacter pylori UM067]